MCAGYRSALKPIATFELSSNTRTLRVRIHNKHLITMYINQLWSKGKAMRKISYLLIACGLSFIVAGCSHIEKMHAKYPLAVYFSSINDYITVRAYSQEGSPIAGGNIKVFNDFDRVIIDESLSDRGIYRFRYPINTVKLTVIITDNEGKQGKRYIEKEDIRPVYPDRYSQWWLNQ